MKIQSTKNFVLLFLVLVIAGMSAGLRAATVTVSTNSNSSAVSFTAADDVVIAAGVTLTVNETTRSCNSLTLAGNGSAITVLTGNSLAVSNAITMSYLTTSVACSISGAGTLSAGSISIGNTTTTPNAANTTLTHTLTSSISELTVTGAITVNSSSNANGSKLGNGRFINSSTGSLTVGGNVVSVNANALNTSTITLSGLATLNLGGSAPVSLSGIGTTSFSLSASTVNYTGAAQTVYTTGTSYTNLGLSGSGIKTLTGLTAVSGNFTMSGTVSATEAANLDVNGNFTIGSGTTFNASSFTLNVAGNWSNSGTFTSSTSTVVLDGASQQSIGGSAETSFNNLTINNTAGAKATVNTTVNGVLNLQSANPDATAGTLDMVNSYGDYSNIYTPYTYENASNVTNTYAQSHDILNSFVLTMGGSATTSGQGDVTGKVKRTTFVEKTSYSFGNQYTTISFNKNTTGGLPTQMLFVITKGSTYGIHSNKTNTVQRLYQVIREGGTSPTTFTIRLHYLDSEANGNTENNYFLWDHHIPYTTNNTPHEHGKTAQDATNNYVELTGHGIGYLNSNISESTGSPNGSKYWMISNQGSTTNNWLGNGSSNWDNLSSWTYGTVPTSSDVVKIQSGVPYNPTIPATASVKSITIEPGATLNGGTGTLTIYGGVLDNGGTGSFVNNGTFNGETSTVVFNYPLSTTQLSTISGTSQFHNIQVTASTILEFLQDASVSITGAITNSGTINFSSNANNVIYNGTDQTVYNNSGTGTYYSLGLSGTNTTLPTTLNLKGNLSYTGTGLTVGSGTVIFNGTLAQAISGTSITFNNLTLNNSQGLSLSSSQAVSGTLTLTSGQLATGSNTLSLGSSASISGAGSSSYVNGNLAWTLGTGAVTKTYAIGDENGYAPVSISFGNISSGGNFTMKAVAGNHPSILTSLINTEKNVNHYYTITNPGISFNSADLTLNWTAGALDGGVTSDNLKIAKYDGSSWTYPTVSSPAGTSIITTGLTSFSDFIVGEEYGYFTWDGSSSSAWSTAANWTPEILPDAARDVVIPNTATDPIISNAFGTPAIAKNLTIELDASVTINSDAALTVSGTLTNNAGANGLQIKSSATTTGSLIQSTAGISATVERYMNDADWTNWQDGWHMISSPLSTQVIADAFTTDPDTEYDFYTWNPASSLWINYKAGSDFTTFNGSGNFSVGKGYLAAYNAEGIKYFTGGTLNVENITFTDLHFSGATSYHLLGNPYSCALLWDGDWPRSNIDGTAKIWSEANQSYSDRSLGSYIPPTNGFMVAVSGGTNSITIPVSKMAHSGTSFFKDTEAIELMLTVRNMENGNAQESKVLIHPNATVEFDREFDSEFLAGYAPSFYSTGLNYHYSTNALPELTAETVIPFAFEPNGATNYRLEFAGFSTLWMDAWLIDNKTGTQQLVSDQWEYVFTSETGDNANRFELLFTEFVSSVEVANSQTQCWYSDSKINLDLAEESAVVQLLDATGKMVFRTLEKGSGFRQIPVHVKPGVYFVKLSGKNLLKTEKLIIL